MPRVISVRRFGVVDVGPRGAECSDVVDRGSRLRNDVHVAAVDLGLCSLCLPGFPLGGYPFTLSTLGVRLVAFECRLAPGERRLRPGDSLLGTLPDVRHFTAKGLAQLVQL